MRKRLIAAFLFSTVLLGLSVILPQIGHADTLHSRVNTGYHDTAGNPIEYTENKNNSASYGSGNAHVSVGGYLEYLGISDGVGDVYGAEVYAYHYFGPGDSRNGWYIDAAQAASIFAQATASEPGQPCEWVLWYVWDSTSGSPVFGGNFC